MSALDADEQRAFRESIERVRGLAANRLRAIDDASRAIAFVVHLHRGIDRVATNAAATGPVPDCAPGCAHCCRVRVEATEPEAFRIARRIRDVAPSAIDGLVDRLRAVATERVAQPAHRSDCAFLVDRRCAIYDVRPATCRTAHSLSVKACESLAATIPQDLRVIVEAEALMTGTSLGYRDAGLASTPRELSAVVLAVLDDETDETRWYARRADSD